MSDEQGWPRSPTHGPHFFVEPDDVSDDLAVLRDDQARHLTTVLRLAPGAPVSVADDSGTLWQGRVATTGDVVRLALTERIDLPDATPRVAVVHALPKGRKLDDVVQRLSEVGVERLVPVHSARSQVELRGQRADKALRRWRAVALAAAKQSRRSRILRVEEVGTWDEALSEVSAGVVLWEGSTVPLGAALDRCAGAEEIVLGIGPEGGLEEREVAQGGLPHASLGPTVLRTETAALVACSVALHRVGRLG